MIKEIKTKTIGLINFNKKSLTILNDLEWKIKFINLDETYLNNLKDSTTNPIYSKINLILYNIKNQNKDKILIKKILSYKFFINSSIIVLINFLDENKKFENSLYKLGVIYCVTFNDPNLKYKINNLFKIQKKSEYNNPQLENISKEILFEIINNTYSNISVINTKDNKILFKNLNNNLNFNNTKKNSIKISDYHDTENNKWYRRSESKIKWLNDKEVKLFVDFEFTDLIKDKKQLLQLNKTKIEFLARMSHELRTPMNVILANAPMILQGFFGEISKLQREKICDIVEHAEELLALINDVLDISKISSGQIKFKKTEFNLSKFLTHITQGFKPLFFNKKSVKLKISIQDNIYITADSLRLKQIFNNLITNAIKFTNIGTITIILEKINSNQIRLSVKDTGIGIEKKYLNDIFKDFFRVPSHKYGGTGLGLSICRSLVKMHNGSISVKSVPLEGSEFSIYLSI